MANPLITTKLYIPPLRHDSVPRPLLIEKLHTGKSVKLTLISAPAGYGKTTILSEWINQKDWRFAWVSLDTQDNEIDRFFAYVIASLNAIGVNVTESIGPKPGEMSAEDSGAYLLPLINQISAVDEQIALVLDDYHRISNPQIHQALTVLLDHLPPNMQLVIATRSDPPLRLAKLRAQGMLCELRVDDLRFSTKEAFAFLNQNLNLGLASEDIATLMEKTEGWVVGLQLAGISLNKHPDKHNFVRAFAGDDRYIADYLLDEALIRQPEQIQNFLLKTSILDRMCASLCDAVTIQTGSQAVLTELDQANLFLIPLDNQRKWYRYHHLFAELLQNRLQRLEDSDIVALQNRASRWFKQNNLLADAINHALVADDAEQIAQLTEEMAVYKMNAGEMHAVMAWLDQQPDERLQRHPWLAVTRTWVLFNSGEYDAAEACLQELEDLLSSQAYPTDLVSRIKGHIAAIRSYVAEVREGALEAIKSAEEALKLLPEKDSQLRAFVTIRWANCLAWLGDLDKAIQALKDGGNAAMRAEDGQLAISAFSEAASLQAIIGELNQAFASIAEIKNYAEEQALMDGRRLPAMGQLYRQYANLLFERNQLLDAAHYAQEAVQISQQWGERESLATALLVLSKVFLALGEYEKYEQCIDQTLAVSRQLSAQAYEYFLQLKIHFDLLWGKPAAAEEWFQNRVPGSLETFTQDSRVERQNYFHYLLHRGEYQEALSVVNNLMEVIGESEGKYYAIRYNAALATVLQLLHYPDKALSALEEALAIAAPQGYIRTFVDQHPVMAELLYQAAQKGIYPDYCRQLLDAFAREGFVPGVGRSDAEELIEPLSDRELEVLSQIALGATNQEIAQALNLSLATVKSHARNIFGKLGVKNRTEAVAKGRLVGLLTKD